MMRHILTSAGGLVLLVAVWLVSDRLIRWSGLPIPGSVAGMALLFLLLSLRPTLQPKWLELFRSASELLIRHLGLLFLPAIVGMLLQFSDFAVSPVKLMLVIVVSTWAAIAVTALLLKKYLAGDDG